VTCRAILIAFSFDSAPESVKKTFVKPEPAIASRRSASSTLAGYTAFGADRHSASACRLIASMMRFCPWPALT
jgi:hypothetical protein